MPPENCFSGRLAASVSEKRSSSSVDFARAFAPDSPSSRPKTTRFSVADSVSSTEAYCPVTPIMPRTVAASSTTSRPKIRADPPSGFSSVASMEMVVVLPAPFGPSTP